VKSEFIDGVLITPLKIINVAGGNVLHAMKASDSGYDNFGEAYFSCIVQGAIKAWKRHREMTLNLIVPVGVMRFVLFDNRPNSISRGCFQQIELSKENYSRLTVPPMVWMGFQGVGDEVSILLNIANIEHRLDEVDRKEMKEIKFDWRINS
jgi:dTDP-4-dehydrorhamnose 3,5-epimerase